MSKKYSENAVVTRAFSTEFQAVEGEKGVIEGVPIVFNKEGHVRDWSGEFKEIIIPEALNNTDMRDVRLFVNHNTDKITLARSKNGNGTMSLDVQPDGVHMRATLDIDGNPEASALYSAIKRGDMDGMSFMFRVRGDTWSDLESAIPTRTINDISIIHEVSVVNTPAYEATTVSARDAEETVSILEEARRAYAEETAKSKGNDMMEVERLKNLNNIRFIRK